MKTVNILYPLACVLLLCLPLWLSQSTTEAPKVEEYIMHRPNPFKVDTVKITEDSLYYPSMRPVPDHAWLWIEETVMVDKPEF